MNLEERLAALESRVQLLEDEAEVRRVVAAYGPLVDAGDAEGTAALWAQDGVYDVDELVMRSAADVEAMVRSRHHQDFIAGGCAHVIGPVHVALHGDEAVAVCHSLMVVSDGGRFVVRRATANVWRLQRGPAGWRVADRTSRVLDGRPEAPELFRTAMRR